MTTIQENVEKPELEMQEVETNSQEGSGETTKELFRREASPPIEENPLPKTPKSPPSSPRVKTLTKQSIKTPSRPVTRKGEATAKKSNSGIPLRMKSGSNQAMKNERKSYRPQQQSSIGPIINRNTLEMQFINNKKRLLQLHSELVEKQRPLLDMHKSLWRTKKQLEEMGKKIPLEDIKIVTLKIDDHSKISESSENTLSETATGLKSSLDGILDICMKLCKRCLLKRDHVVKVLEDATKSAVDIEGLELELEELKREKGELESSMESTFKENEVKIGELLANWQKAVKTANPNTEAAARIMELEEVVTQHQKAISEGEDNLVNLTRKFEDKKTSLEKTINELHDKNNKLEEEIKKEKRTSNENLMKTRNLRTKVTELEVKARETEDKHNEALKKLSQLQEQLRKKEVQWLKEKDDFKKNEELLQQKFNEKQASLDSRCLVNITLKAINELIMPSVVPNIKEEVKLRLKDMERFQKATEAQHKTYKTFETQIELKDHELSILQNQKEMMTTKVVQLENQLSEMKQHLEEKDREIEELSMKKESLPAIEYNPKENNWEEFIEYKQKITDLQTNIQEQSEQISKMQSSLKAHAQLAAALKLEKDNAVKYATQLRDALHEARDEIDYKNKTIYKIHEKLVLRENVCDKLKAELKEYATGTEYFGGKWNKARCQICRSSMENEKQMDCSDAEVGSKSIKSGPKYVSDSLIGMSVKKVDHLRARLDSLKKMKLPFSLGKTHSDFGNSFLGDSNQPNKAGNSQLRKQIEIRGKLYQILQKHADQSCEDFINLLKISVSKEARDPHELKPSNTNHRSDCGVDSALHKYSNIEITESFSHYVDRSAFNPMCDKLQESFIFESDEVNN